LATGQSLWFKDIAAILKAEYPQLENLPKGEMPSFLLRILALFNDDLRVLSADLGTFHETDATYVSNMTHVLPRPAKEAILAGAESLIASGAVRLS
jgi:hypothetical protein